MSVTIRDFEKLKQIKDLQCWISYAPNVGTIEKAIEEMNKLWKDHNRKKSGSSKGNDLVLDENNYGQYMQYYLIDLNAQIHAKLIEGEKVIIKSEWLRNHLNSNKGIYLNEVFRKKNNVELAKNKIDKRVSFLPAEKSNPEYDRLFAKAFKECLFEDGLRQMGFCWKSKQELDALDQNLERLERKLFKES